MKLLTLPKSYPESVVRKALYWCSTDGNWTLKEDEKNWFIACEDEHDEFESTLHRHLNDFLLRYELDQKTGHLRHAIVESALKGLIKRVG